MKVALVHDDLVQWGGAERVLLAISELFPEAPIFTSVYDSSNRNLATHFKDRRIVTSFMQKIPGWKFLYKALLGIYPIAFEQFDFSEFDLVISQTTRFAKVIITKPDTKHVCYCHTPPRFLWHLSARRPFGMFFSGHRLFDQVTSHRVDRFLAGSKNAQARLKKFYRADSRLLWPFVDDIFFAASDQSFDGGYYLVVTRLNKYKNVELVVRTFNRNRRKLKIVGVGPELGILSSQALDNIEFLGSLSDDVLVNVMSGATGVIVAAEEDFGLVGLEAQALGKPVIAFGSGGAMETIINGKTGVFFEDLTMVALDEAIERLEKLKLSPEDCRENARRFSKQIFQKNLLSLVN